MAAITPYEPTNSVATTARLFEQILEVARISALEEMASGIAHELNQPIGAITTFAQAGKRMLEKPQPMVRQTADVLQHISDEALHAGQGIRRIRGLFNARDGLRTTCRLTDVVHEVLPVLQVLADRAGAKLDVDLAVDVPQVTVDRLRIAHVLFTLLQNALEAQSGDADTSASVRIKISGDRHVVRTEVEDRGSGVPENAREHLFRPFFTTKEHGTGLGLASSRGIIEAHGGTIGFEDVAGGGARFWFQLPIAPTADGDDAQ